MVSCCHLEVGIVITDMELGVMLDDAEIEEELAPGVITLCRGHKHDGHVVTKVELISKPSVNRTLSRLS